MQKSAPELVEIAAAQLNQRLDNFLMKHLQGVPRTHVYRIIRKGEVRVNKKRCKPEYRLQLGDLVRIPPLRQGTGVIEKRRPPPHLLVQLEQQTLFENEHMLIIDKPPGIAVHAGSGVDYGVIDALRLLHPHADIELVHRLDRDTSGCLLLAKHRPALLCLQTALREHKLNKTYIAAVQGRWPRAMTTISKPLRKYHLANGERRVTVDDNGKPATTEIRLIRAGNRCSVIEVGLITGRTHQIRVHCQTEGHAIAGDTKYGDQAFNRDMRSQGMRRLMLHAISLKLPASRYHPSMVIDAAVPQEFELLLDSAANLS